MTHMVGNKECNEEGRFYVTFAKGDKFMSYYFFFYLK